MAISKILSSFINDKAGIYDASTNSFDLLDANGNSKQLRIVEFAKERGKANLPPADASIPDDIEQKIVQRIKDHERQAREVYNSNLKVLLSRLKSLSTQSKVNELSTIADNAESDFSSQVQQAGLHLYLSRLKVTETEDELTRFKEKHGLINNAVYSTSKVKSFGVIAILVLIETLLNGYFFMKQSDFGWIGGIGFSSVLSLLNISLGCFLGHFGYRFLHHKKALVKCWGAAICIFFLCSILTVNLAVSQYRTLMMNADAADSSAIERQVNEDYEPGKGAPPLPLTQQAYQNFVAHPFGIHDMEAWLLVCLGMIFSLVTSYKVYRSDDPYFRYGEFSRRREHAIHDYTNITTKFLDDLQGLYADIMEHLEGTQRDISSAKGEAASIKASYINWQNLIAGYLGHLEAVGRILISEYRYTNMSVRTAEAPAFFKKEWGLDSADLNDFSADFDSENMSIDAAIEAAHDIYIKVAARIKDSYEQARKTYQSIEQLQPSQVKPEEFHKWLTQEIGSDNDIKLAVVA